MSEIENVRRQLNEIEHNYNRLLEELQQIADAKGDTASEDPDYVQKYNDAAAMNAQFEALQSQLAGLEAAAPAASPTANVASAIDAIDAVSPDGSAPPQAPDAAMPAVGTGSVAPDGTTVSPEAAAQPEAVAPPAPKYVTVERIRVEVEKIHEQSWNFVGIASNVSSAVQDLANKGGYISENVLEKKFGKLTFLCPFEVDFQIGGLISAIARRSGPVAGLIYYPQAIPTPQASATLGQLMQQFLASGAPRGHVVVFLKANKVEIGDDKVSIIVGGLTEQDGRILQGLKRLGSVFSDSTTFYRGNLLDDIKSMAGKLGLKLITLVCTSNVILNQDKLQALIESF